MTRIGIDVGGTFTDLVATDEGGAAAHDFKLLSIPDNPAAAIGMSRETAVLSDLHRKVPEGTIPSRKLFFNQDSLAIGRG
jgi:N-methylhydantoinase A/oxoprolinase/acetone carboxylase beta subunit